MRTTLQGLPEELISNIAARLHADDLASFRLVSRATEQKSFHEFATEHFSEKCFMFTTDSLKVLVQISTCPRLRGYLRHIHFVTATFSELAFNCSRGRNCSWQPSLKQKQAFRDYIEDQQLLKTTNRDKEMLSEAFVNLPSLGTVSIDDSPSTIDPSVDYRGRNKVPRLCGRPPLFASHAASEDDLKEYDAFFRHVWEVVVYAVQHVQNLTHFATHLTKANGVPIAWLNTTKFSQSISAFKTLNTLLLRIRSHKRAGCIDEKSRQDVTKRELKTLRNFARALPSLEVLDLSFDSTKATGSYLIAFTAGLDLGKITTLYLDGVAVSAASLVGILQRSESIKDLRLIFTNLTKGSWLAVLKMLQTMSERLQHLHLMYLLEGGHKAYFLKQVEEDDLGHPFYGHDDGLYDGEFSDEYLTDEDLPPLEPGGILPLEIENATACDDHIPSIDNMGAENIQEGSAVNGSLPETTNVPVTSAPATATNPPSHSNSNHVRPGDFDSGERGYFVCVQGAEIAAQLPTFIQEYNLGLDVEEAMGLPPGLGGGPPALMNNFLTMIGAALGVPPGAQPPHAGNSTAGGGPNGGVTTIPMHVPPFGPSLPPTNTSTAPSTNPASNTNTGATSSALSTLWDGVEGEWEEDGDEENHNVESP